MITLQVICNRAAGSLKPLQGLNNGPVGYGSLVDVSHSYTRLGVPYVRLHDTNWPHPREVDIPQVFPDFDADPEDPDSYDFARTDAYIQKIVDTGARIIYRLGVSIEHTEQKYYTQPPADFDKWARICLGIVKHYHDRVAYWEIWNEADIGDRMWSGTVEQYFDLYETTAKLLKAYDPTLQVGGPATAKLEPPHPQADFLPRFLEFCQAHDCPLDFVSWHKYTTDPNVVVAHAVEVRELMDRYGYPDATSHLNEWNYTPFEGAIWGVGNECARRRAFERQKSEEGASFIATTLTLLQDAPVDIATYYDGQPLALYCGIFDAYGVPQKAYRAFEGFSRLLGYPTRFPVTGTSPDGELQCLAAGSLAFDEVALLVSRFGGDSSEVEIELVGLQDATPHSYELRMIDADCALDVVDSRMLAPDETRLRVAMASHAVALITIN